MKYVFCMKKNVDVNVTGIHSRPGEPTEKIVTTSMGMYEVLDDGSKILEYVKNNYDKYNILLCYEEVDEKYDNYEERVKREQFYLLLRPC